MSVIKYDPTKFTAHANDLMDEFIVFRDSPDRPPNLSEEQLYLVWSTQKISNLQLMVFQLVDAVQVLNRKNNIL